jgi:hypothetical protein
MGIRTFLLVFFTVIFIVSLGVFFTIFILFAGNGDYERSCIEDSGPVCGSDEVTYANECDAFSAGVEVYYSGDCLEEGLICDFSSGPVCGSDEVTYANECAALTSDINEFSAGPCSADEVMGPDSGFSEPPKFEGIDTRYDNIPTGEGEEEIPSMEFDDGDEIVDPAL